MTANSAYYDYSDYVAAASRTTGYVLGAEFEEKLAVLEPGELRDSLELDTTGMTDVFDGYDTAYIAEAYIKVLRLTGYAEKAIRDKYAKLQTAVDAKAMANESMTLYFASATKYKHDELHKDIMFILLLECGLLTALVALLSIGYENHHNTSHTIYATTTGRRIVYHKLLASLSAGMFAFAVLTLLTLGLYFALNDYGNIWDSSVSSGFNYIIDFLAGSRPFATWQSYSVLTYLLAVLCISALLTLCFGHMAFIIGMWLKNSYMGFLIFIIINATTVVLSSWYLFRYYAMLSPVWLWLKRSLWFTDGGPDILWRNFEMLGVCVSLSFLVVLCAFSFIIFKKRNIY